MPQKRGRARELVILEVVRDLLAEQGYERLTVDAVVARAKASKATIYTRWPDKASLVAAALNARSLDQPRVAPEADDLRDDLLHLVALFVKIAESESLTAFVSVLIAAGAEAALADAVRGSALEPRRQDCLDVVRRAVVRGELADDRAAPELFDAIMGKILVRYVLERLTLDDETQAKFVDRVLLPMLRTDVPVTSSR